MGKYSPLCTRQFMDGPDAAHPTPPHGVTTPLPTGNDVTPDNLPVGESPATAPVVSHLLQPLW